MADMVSSLGTRLRHEDLVTPVSWDGRPSFSLRQTGEVQVDASSPSYLDDLLVLAEAPANQICLKTAVILATIDDEFIARGLVLNYGPGKSAIQMRFAGPDAVLCRQDLWTRQEGFLFVALPAGTRPVAVTRRYAHLGTLATDTLSMSPEIAARRATMRGKLQPLRRHVFLPTEAPRSWPGLP